MKQFNGNDSHNVFHTVYVQLQRSCHFTGISKTQKKKITFEEGLIMTQLHSRCGSSVCIRTKMELESVKNNKQQRTNSCLVEQ